MRVFLSLAIFACMTSYGYAQVSGPGLGNGGNAPSCFDYLDDIKTCEDYETEWEDDIANWDVCENACVIVNGVSECVGTSEEPELQGHLEVLEMEVADGGWSDKEDDEVPCVLMVTCVCVEVGTTTNCSRIDSDETTPWKTKTQEIGTGEEDCGTAGP